MVDETGDDVVMTDRVVAIVPVKNLSAVKGRLSSRLSPAERALFALESLDQVLAATTGSGAIAASLVVSPDPRVRSRALAAGASAVDEADAIAVIAKWSVDDSHNRALEFAREVAIRRWQPSALLVLAADLPLVLPEDIAALVARGDGERTIVIAPDRQGTGTNALFMRPPDALSFQFGADSCRLHAAEATERGLCIEVYRSVGTAHDVDLPRDLDELNR